MGDHFSQVLGAVMLSLFGCAGQVSEPAMDPASWQEDGRSSSAALSSSFINYTTHLPSWLADSSAITKMPEDFVMYF